MFLSPFVVDGVLRNLKEVVVIYRKLKLNTYRSEDAMKDLYKDFEERWGISILETIVNQSDSQLAFLDTDFNFIYVNDAYALGSGYSKEELIGRNHFDLFPDSENQEIFIKTRDSGKAVTYRAKPFIYKYQPWRETTYWNWTLTPVKNATNQVIGLILYLREATAEVKLSHALEAAMNLTQQQEALLRTVLDQLPLGVVIGTAPSGEIILSNRMSQEIWKEPVTSFKELKGFHVDGTPYADDEWPLYRSIFHEETVREEIIHIQCRDGSYTVIEANSAPIRDTSGKIIAGVVVFDDVSERMKQNLEKMQQYEVLGNLAGGIAHDFNNFLTSILSNVQLAQLKLARGIDIGCLFTRIENTIAAASNLTRQLLTFSKGGAPILKPTSLKEVLIDTADFVLRGSKSKWSYVIADDLWPANVDAGQISQVISNLFLNADQAMPDGGTIQFTATNTVVQPENLLNLKPGRYIKIQIKDHGVGIPKECLNKIFDPYYTTKKNGNGLGLFMALSIISKHQGHISVESVVNQGTTFHIYLPAADELIPPPRPTALRRLKGKGRILIMDDVPTILQATSEMLETIGYEVKTARDGEEAVTLYQEYKKMGKPFDAVIMDLTVPGGMGGKAALEELKKFDPEVKAIVSSGYSHDPILADCKAYGFYAQVAKPYKISELVQILQSIPK